MKLTNVLLISISTIAGLLSAGCQQKATIQAPVIYEEPQKVVAPIKKKYVIPVKVNSVSVTGSAEALKRLTVGGPHERVLDLSPDGKWLLLETYKQQKSNRVLQKMKLSNGIKMLLSPESSSNKHAAWNPNGKSYIFSTNRMTHYSIVQSMGVNGGSGVKFITKSALGDAKYPDVSSDGKQIVFSVDDNLAMVKPNGMDLIIFGSGYRPKFSPNDKKILYAQKVGAYRHIYIMNADGQEIIQLTSERAKDFAANWSPNGRKIAFVSDRVGGHRHLFIMNIDGSNITQLTDGQFNVNSLEWGDDGYIYFSADAGGNEDVWRLKPKR